MATFMRFLNVSTQLTPAPVAGSTSKQVLLIGQRTTSGKLILPQNGFPQPNLYVPVQLPAFANGADATNYIFNYGLVTSIGINFTLDLPAPTTVTSVNGQTTLTWTNIPAGFVALTGFALAGILSQDLVNSAVVSAGIISGTATMIVQGSPAFVTSGDSGDPMVLSGLNNVQYPDPDASDPISLMTWDFYQTALDATPPTQGFPSAFLSIISDRDSTINANPTGFILPAPDSVTTSGSNVTLTYNYSSADVEPLPSVTDDIITESGLSTPALQYYISNLTNFGYLPTTAYGNTAVGQAVTLPTDSTLTLFYANGVYLRGSANNNGIDYSPDGVTWTPSSVTVGNFAKFTWNGTVYVAVSNSNLGIYYSVNGITWTHSNKTTGNFGDVKFANTKFVASSTAGLFYSSDGITWTICSGSGTASFAAIVYGIGDAGGVWVGVTSNADAWNSVDGITFAALTISSDGFFSASFANGLFQLGGNGTGIVYSVDGTTFLASDLTTLNIYKIIYNQNINLWLTGTSVGIYISTNGISWTITSSPTATGVFADFAYSNTVIIAASTAGLYRSTNGTNWTLCSGTGATGSYTSIIYNAGLFIAGSTTGISQSLTGIIWVAGTTAVSGKFNGFVVNPTDDGGTVVISLINAGSGFHTGTTVTVSLDNTLSVFNFLDNINLYGAVLQFPITTKSQVTTTQAAFFNGITALNQPDQVLNNHYFTYGAAGNISVLPSSAATLPNINNQLNIFVTYPYIAQFGDIPYENSAGNVAGGRFTAGVMYMLANGDTPFPSLGGSTINHFPVSSIANTTSYQNTQGGTGDIAVTQGWLPLAPNSSNIVTILQSNTSMTTIPNTTVQDNEFRYTHIWDSVRWIKQQVAQLYQKISVLPNNAGSAFINPPFIRQFRTGIIAILTQGQLLGMLQNVELYQNLVTVTPNTLEPTQVDAYIPSQIVPQLNGANVLINVFSSLYKFTNTATGV